MLTSSIENSADCSCSDGSSSVSWASCTAIIVSSSLPIASSELWVAAASSINPVTSLLISASSSSSIGSITTVSAGSFLNRNNTSKSSSIARSAKPNLLIRIFLTLLIIDSNGLSTSWTNAASRFTDSVYSSSFADDSEISSAASVSATTSSSNGSSSVSATTSSSNGSSSVSATTSSSNGSSSVSVVSLTVVSSVTGSFKISGDAASTSPSSWIVDVSALAANCVWYAANSSSFRFSNGWSWATSVSSSFSLALSSMFSWVNVSIVSSATNKSFDLVGSDSPVSCVACAPSSATTNLNSGSACSISFVTSFFCLSTSISLTSCVCSFETAPSSNITSPQAACCDRTFLRASAAVNSYMAASSGMSRTYPPFSPLIFWLINASGLAL